MDTTESLGYLKGLIEGLDLGDKKKETKVFSAIVDVLSNLVSASTVKGEIGRAHV